MAMKKTKKNPRETVIILIPRDLKSRIQRHAKAETKRTGAYVSMASLINRAASEFMTTISRI